MKKLKYLIPITLIITVIVTLFVVTNVYAETTEGYFTYTVSGGEATITDVDKSINGDVIIPSTLGGYPVISIGYSAFYNCNNLTSIVIPDSVTHIGNEAFASCDYLTSITIPDSVTSIGYDAFYRCSSLTSVYITDIAVWCNIEHETYREDRDRLYFSNPLKYAYSLYVDDVYTTKITIPNDVTEIKACAFYGSKGIVEVIIPDSVTSIEESAFSWCSRLTSLTIGKSVKSVGNEAFRECSSLTSVVIPDSVTSIGSFAFEYCRSLTSITIPDSVTSIGDWAFSYCGNLTSVNIPDSVTSIDSYTFYNCSSLTSIEIPDSVKSIGSSAFFGCSSLTSVVIPDSVTSIDYDAFSGCSALTTVYYEGQKSDWDKIIIDDGNEYLRRANIIFAGSDMPIYNISLSSTPTGCGKVSGAGNYEQGASVTLKATANEGYIFKGWYENGELVSADATITFIAETDRTLTAKFASKADEIMYGDVNGDGQINMEDVILLRQYIASYNYETGSSTVVLGPQQ